MAKRTGERIDGPFKHGRRWRLRIARPMGGRDYLSFATEAEAQERKAALVRRVEGRTVMDGIAAYVEARKPDLRAGSVATLEHRLHALHGDLLRFSELTPAKAARLYADRAAETKVDTHRNELAVAKAFGAWLVKKGWIRVNPWAAVEGVGERNRGKDQLHIDEARVFEAKCTEAAKVGGEGAIAALCALLLGLRSHEILQRVSRDVDDGGRMLWVTKSKTKAGVRRVRVPAELAELLLTLKRDIPTAPLWPGRQTGGRTSTFRSASWLRKQVKALCTAAGVPEVVPQSLRGLHATLATDAGETADAVAAALGQASSGVTLAHYIDSEAAEDARTRRTLRVLRGGRT